VAYRFEELSRGLISEFTKTCDNDPDTTSGDHIYNLSLGGRILIGVNKVEHYNSQQKMKEGDDTYVVLLATTSNKGMYRVKHHGMLPLVEQLGMEFYKA